MENLPEALEAKLIQALLNMPNWEPKILADALGISVPYLSQLKNSQRRNPNNDVRIRLYEIAEQEGLKIIEAITISEDKKRIAELEQENAHLKKMCDQFIQIIRTTQSLLPDMDNLERELLKNGKL